MSSNKLIAHALTMYKGQPSSADVELLRFISLTRTASNCMSGVIEAYSDFH